MVGKGLEVLKYEFMIKFFAHEKNPALKTGSHRLSIFLMFSSERAHLGSSFVVPCSDACNSSVKE